MNIDKGIFREIWDEQMWSDHEGGNTSMKDDMNEKNQKENG